MGFGKDGRGVIMRFGDNADDVSALAALTALKVTASITLGEDFRLIKIAELLAYVTGLVADEALQLGIADGELSVAEIAEAIVVAGPSDRNDNLARERAERPVWLLGGVAAGDGGGAGAAGLIKSMKMLQHEKVLRWTFSDPEGFDFFWWNPTNAAISAGSQEASLRCKLFGVWVT